VAPGELWARARPRLLAVIGLALLTTVAVVALWGLLVLPGILLLVAGETAAGALLLVLGILVALALSVFLWVRWALAGPALLLEDQGVLASLRRSWRLLAGSWWRAFGILLLTQIVVGVGSSIVQAPFTVVGSLLIGVQDRPYASLPLTLLYLVVSNIGTVVAGAIFYPFGAAVTALLYVDVRMRREGLDVQLLRAAEAS
jgi:hypothetical protein